MTYLLYVYLCINIFLCKLIYMIQGNVINLFTKPHIDTSKSFLALQCGMQILSISMCVMAF